MRLALEYGQESGARRTTAGGAGLAMQYMQGLYVHVLCGPPPNVYTNLIYLWPVARGRTGSYRRGPHVFYNVQYLYV
jgi:hypothetical protein